MESNELPNWFEVTARGNFEHFLEPLADQEGLRCLQIGAFAGDASEWLLTNVVTGKGALLVDVDTWEGSPEAAHEELDWAEVEDAYQSRVQPHLGRFMSLKMTSDEFFETDDEQYDFVYVDGNHTYEQVLRDAENAHKALKVGGLIIFDDYLWGELNQEGGRPKEAIENFFDAHPGEYQLLGLNGQAIMKKLEPAPLPWWRK